MSSGPCPLSSELSIQVPLQTHSTKSADQQICQNKPTFQSLRSRPGPPSPDPPFQALACCRAPDRPTVVACSSRPLSDRRACLPCFSKPSPTVAGVVAVSMLWGVGPRPAKHCSCMLAAWTSSTTLCQRLDRAEGRTTYSAQGTIWQQTTGPRTTDTALTKS